MSIIQGAEDKQYVINPTTNRPISVGGRIHIQLIRDGLLRGQVPKVGRPKATLTPRRQNSTPKRLRTTQPTALTPPPLHRLSRRALSPALDGLEFVNARYSTDSDTEEFAGSDAAEFSWSSGPEEEYGTQPPDALLSGGGEYGEQSLEAREMYR
jgi:hypothetical protein